MKLRSPLRRRPGRSRRAAFDSLESRALLASIAVTTLADSGAGSLRQAIADAAPGDTIDLTGLSGTITLNSQLTLDRNLTIAGPGASSLAISGSGTRVVAQTAGAISMSGLTIQNGYAYKGAGYYLTGGTASLTRVVIQNNLATNAGAGIAVESGLATVGLTLTESAVLSNTVTSASSSVQGGGLDVFATRGDGTAGGTVNLSIVRSTVAQNQVVSSAGMAQGAGMYLYAPGGRFSGGYGGTINAELVDSTVASNMAVSSHWMGGAIGGGVYIWCDSGSNTPSGGGYATLNATGSTIASNMVNSVGAMLGAELYINGPWGAGTWATTVNLQNTIVDGQAYIGSPGLIVGGANSLIASTAGQQSPFSNGVNGNVVGQPANLAALADNGGPTWTMALQAGSPAIDAGDDAEASATDQRGAPRIGVADIGAFEFASIVTPPNAAPAWATSVVPAATLSLAYATTVSATDDDPGDALAITLVSGPASLSVVDHGDGTATLRGTPSIGDLGTQTVTLRVSDGTTTTDQAFNLVVHSLPVAIVDRMLLVNGTDGPDDVQVWSRRDGTTRVVRNGLARTFSTDLIDRVSIQTYGGADAIAATVKDRPIHVRAGADNDTVQTGVGDDSVSAGAGADVVRTGDGNDRVYGDAGDDSIEAGGGRNTVWGGDGNDTIAGGATIDRLRGDDGDDVLIGARAADWIEGGAGTDASDGDPADVLDSVENTVV